MDIRPFSLWRLGGKKNCDAVTLDKTPKQTNAGDWTNSPQKSHLLAVWDPKVIWLISKQLTAFNQLVVFKMCALTKDTTLPVVPPPFTVQLTSQRPKVFVSVKGLNSAAR